MAYLCNFPATEPLVGKELGGSRYMRAAVAAVESEAGRISSHLMPMMDSGDLKGWYMDNCVG